MTEDKRTELSKEVQGTHLLEESVGQQCRCRRSMEDRKRHVCVWTVNTWNQIRSLVLKKQWPALRLLLQTQLDQVVQGDRVVFRSGTLRSVGWRRGAAVRQASRGHALPDAWVNPGAWHLQAAQLAQREGSDVQQAAVGATQLLKQHLNRTNQTLIQTDKPLLLFEWKSLYYLSGGHVLERHPATDQFTGHDA